MLLCQVFFMLSVTFLIAMSSDIVQNVMFLTAECLIILSVVYAECHIFFHPLHFVTQKAENGATTLAITTFSKMALSITFSVIILSVYAECCVSHCYVE